MSQDAIDAIIDQWRRERPDLDPSAKHITGRLLRLTSLIRARYADAFAPLGLSGGQYGVLAALRRAGDPFELTPSALTRSQLMTSGGMTPVIDGLERRGLVERRPNPDDRRGRLVRLTADGRETIDRAMEVHSAAEHAAVDGLSPDEREQLTALLRRLLVLVEGPVSP